MHLYNIPIIQQDLRHEEAIIQAANAFEYLEKIISEIFDTINTRIDKNNKRVENIRERIATANSKVESLFGSNKAITIFSPAKYPAGEVCKDIDMTFPPDKKTNIKLNTTYEVQSGIDPVNHKNLQDKLQFYHVRTSDEGDNSKLPIPEGLGSSPAYIDSVNALLLFNTQENPYEKYNKKLDPLSGSIRKISAIEIVNANSGKKMEAAPFSIANRNITMKKNTDNFFYTPETNNAPQLDVPFDLPDLPGIADDITFVYSENEIITPSIGNFPFIVNDELPILPEPEKLAKEAKSNIEIMDMGSTNLGDNSNHQIVILPPPPPILPPPPPPPLPVETNMLATQITGQNTSNPSTADPHVPPGTDARMNLMAAIRQAGGKAKLRASEQKKENSQGKEEKLLQPKSGGDLMADLHNKLLMRRKGISGAKDLTGNGNVMDRISAMIPPPPRPQARGVSTTEGSEDEDWQ